MNVDKLVVQKNPKRMGEIRGESLKRTNRSSILNRSLIIARRSSCSVEYEASVTSKKYSYDSPVYSAGAIAKLRSLPHVLEQPAGSIALPTPCTMQNAANDNRCGLCGYGRRVRAERRAECDPKETYDWPVSRGR